MQNCLWIKGGRIVDPAAGRDETGDLFARDGVFVADLTPAEREGARIVDAKGRVVCPGLVDLHTHLCEPGKAHKETIETGTAAAAAGGYTTLVCMPDTSPAIDSVANLRLLNGLIENAAKVRVLPAGCLTKGSDGNQLANLGSFKDNGVVAVTDNPNCVQNNEVMRRAVEYAAMFDLPVLDHCQDYDLSRGACMHEGPVSLRMGLQGFPAAAEDVIVSRNVTLSTYSNARIHLQSVSSGKAVDIIKRAKGRKVRITAETTPHNIALTDEALKGYKTYFKTNPPLRSEEDRQSLLEALADGTLDAIATGHSPHNHDEKDVEFDCAPFGVIGLETALAVGLEQLHGSGRMSLAATLALYTCNPARVLGLEVGTLAPGVSADVCILDMDAEWTYSKEMIKSRSPNSPFLGKRFKGRVVETYFKGGCVYCG